MHEGFNPCAKSVELAGSDVLKISVDPLKWAWEPLRDGSLKRLQLFLEHHPHIPVADWFPVLLEQAKTIDISLKEVNLGTLARGVSTFNRQFTEAEPYVRQLLDRAIAELVSFSDRALGRLDKDEPPTHN